MSERTEKESQSEDWDCAQQAGLPFLSVTELRNRPPGVVWCYHHSEVEDSEKVF